MKIPHLLSAAALIAGSQFSVLAEPPPYGPSQDTWGGCVDQLPNVDGIIGVICPARIPVKSLTMPRLVASAKAACLTMERASFELIKGEYFCKYVTRSVSVRPLQPGRRPPTVKN